MIMATRRRTKKYYLSDLLDSFQLVDLSEDELIDDNDLDRERYCNDSEIEDDTNTVALW